MSAMSFIRVARKAVGMTPHPEYPNLESVLEIEAAEVHNDYGVLARVIPPIVVFIGLAFFVAAWMEERPVLYVAGMALSLSSVGLYYLLKWADSRIPASKKRLRRLAEPIWNRYRSVSSLIGVEPAISVNVATILEEAAGIYLKHSAGRPLKRKQFGEVYERSVQALEAGLARLLELADHKTVSTQELELMAGWAYPLLDEIRDMDQALDRHILAAERASYADPISRLREARAELQGVESALIELQQNRL